MLCREQLRLQHFNSHTPCGVRLDPTLFKPVQRYFNSHTPCGVRHKSPQTAANFFTISTHTPLAGCDPLILSAFSCDPPISTHTPLAGCDASAKTGACSTTNFNSHTPCGVRRGFPLYLCTDRAFQLTHPLRGATCSAPYRSFHSFYFNSHTPCGVRPAYNLLPLIGDVISTHTPLAGCDGHSAAPL